MARSSGGLSEVSPIFYSYMYFACFGISGFFHVLLWLSL
jgi:hypothetical protein